MLFFSFKTLQQIRTYFVLLICGTFKSKTIKTLCFYCFLKHYLASNIIFTCEETQSCKIIFTIDDEI
jgi:hypothetical protein